MNNEKQRIAIAEACGLPKPYSKWSGADGGTLCHSVTVEDGLKRAKHIPDYLNDLNAMHEAEKVLTVGQRIEYVREIGFIFTGRNDRAIPDWWLIHLATAELRAEAFLRAIGKWEDEA